MFHQLLIRVVAFLVEDHPLHICGCTLSWLSLVSSLVLGNWMLYQLLTNPMWAYSIDTHITNILKHLHTTCPSHHSMLCRKVMSELPIINDENINPCIQHKVKKEECSSTWEKQDILHARKETSYRCSVHYDSTTSFSHVENSHFGTLDDARNVYFG